MTCKTFWAFPSLAGKTKFLTGCHTLKKESLQKHSVGGGHLSACDAFLAKQQPVQISLLAQWLRDVDKSWKAGKKPAVRVIFPAGNQPTTFEKRPLWPKVPTYYICISVCDKY